MASLRKCRIPAATLAGILLIAGCTGSNPDPRSESSVISPDNGNTSAANDDSFQGVMGIVDGVARTPEDVQAAWENRHNAIQELVAECMKDLGFDYIPVPPESSGATSDPTLVQPENRDWVAQWGYMVVNRPYASEEQNRVEVAQSDPNAAIMERLSPGERDEFLVALDGTPPNYDDGCRHWAYSQPLAPTPADLRNSDEFAPLFQALEEMYASLDYELAEPERDWSECMANSGFPGFDRPWDASESISNAYLEWNNAQDWENWDWATNGDPNSTNTPELAALAAREVEVALADFDCRVSTDFEFRMQERRAAAEDSFFNDNHSAFRALRDAAEQLNWS